MEMAAADWDGGWRHDGWAEAPGILVQATQTPPPPWTVGEGYLTASMGAPLGRNWPAARAVALLRVDLTRSSETGTVRGLRWHNQPRERRGV